MQTCDFIIDNLKKENKQCQHNFMISLFRNSPGICLPVGSHADHLSFHYNTEKKSKKKSEENSEKNLEIKYDMSILHLLSVLEPFLISYIHI